MNEDIDPATLEIFKTVLESESGQLWFNRYLGLQMQQARFRVYSEHNGLHIMMSFNGYNVGHYVERGAETYCRECNCVKPKAEKKSLTDRMWSFITDWS